MNELHINGKKYAPKKDITPYELANVLKMFAFALSGVCFDAETHIADNGLERHFEEVTE